MVEFLVGPPRAGKSTYVQQWQSILGDRPRVVINSDSIRLALHGQRYAFEAETFVFAIKHIMIRCFKNQGYDILVDGTHSSEISIQRILEIDINAKPICLFNISPDECKRRARKDSMLDLGPPIDRICSNISAVCGENYWLNPDSYLLFEEYIDGIRKKIVNKKNLNYSL